jgi:1-deoxy-D-xylulose-5-phosphate synthase
MVLPAERAAESLAGQGIEATVVNTRFVKPIDERLVLDLATRCGGIVTVEENVRAGGFGSAVLELLDAHSIEAATRVLAIPDRVFEQASQSRLREMAGLTSADIAAAASDLLREKASPQAGMPYTARKSIR